MSRRAGADMMGMTNSTTISMNVHLCHLCSLYHSLGPSLGDVFESYSEWLPAAAEALGRFDIVDRHAEVVWTETPCLVCGEDGLARRYEHPATVWDGSAV